MWGQYFNPSPKTVLYLSLIGAYMSKRALTLVNHYAPVLLEESDERSSCSIISTQKTRETQGKERTDGYSQPSQIP